MQTIRNIIEIAVKHCLKDAADVWFIEKNLAEILLLPEIKPYKNKTFGSIINKKSMKIKPCRPMTLEELQVSQIVCDINNMDFNELFSRSRKRETVEIRMILITFLYVYRAYTYVNVASMFGRDHSTIIHNINTHDDLLDTDSLYAVKYFKTLSKIKEEMPHLFIDQQVIDNQNIEYIKIKAERKAKKSKYALR
jgi:hypothetical protein